MSSRSTAQNGVLFLHPPPLRLPTCAERPRNAAGTSCIVQPLNFCTQTQARNRFSAHPRTLHCLFPPQSFRFLSLKCAPGPAPKRGCVRSSWEPAGVEGESMSDGRRRKTGAWRLHVVMECDEKGEQEAVGTRIVRARVCVTVLGEY